jgi:ABC-type glycerol-3-phosphate transport system substrate-binding protein
MVYTGSYVLRDVKNRDAYPHDFKLAFAMPPLNPKYPDRKFYQAGLQDPVMVNPKTPHMDESLKFLKWFYDEGFSYFIPGGRTPARKDYPADKVAELFIAGYEDLIDKDSFMRVLSADRIPGVIYQGADMDEAHLLTLPEFEEAYVGNKTPAEALAAMKSKADNLLANR